MSDLIEYIYIIFPGLEESGLLWPAIFICVVILLLLIWLILRRVRLWYWKVNVQVDALRDVNRQLQALEEELRESTASATPTVTIEETAAENKIEAEIESETENEIENEDDNEIQIPKTMETVSIIGKTGIIYTEEELEMLIRD